MVDKIKLVQGDTGPQVRLTLIDDITGEPIDLTGATVTLHFRALGGDTAIFSRQIYVNPQTTVEGKAIITWEQGDLDVPAGEYEGEIEIYWQTTEVRQTIYDLLKFKVRGDIA